jgi:hypothetical protein
MVTSDWLRKRIMPARKEESPMLKGDELVQKRALFLYYLYEQGAIAHNSAIGAADLQEAIEVNDQDFESLHQNLSHAKLVKKRGGVAWYIGDKAGRGEPEFWLTDVGLQEARKIAQAVQNSAKPAKRPMGFSRPDNDE